MHFCHCMYSVRYHQQLSVIVKQLHRCTWILLERLLLPRPLSPSRMRRMLGWSQLHTLLGTEQLHFEPNIWIHMYVRWFRVLYASYIGTGLHLHAKLLHFIQQHMLINAKMPRHFRRMPELFRFSLLTMRHCQPFRIRLHKYKLRLCLTVLFWWRDMLIMCNKWRCLWCLCQSNSLSIMHC